MKNTQEKGFMQEIADKTLGKISKIPGGKWLAITGSMVSAFIALEQKAISETLKTYLAIDGNSQTEIISNNPNCKVNKEKLTLECEMEEKDPEKLPLIKVIPISACSKTDDKETNKKFKNKPIVSGSGKVCEIGDKSSTPQKNNTEKSSPSTPFSKIKEYLETRGIDLEKIRKEETRNMIRWGIIEEKNAKNYQAQFNNMEFDPKELEGIDLKNQWIVLGVDNITIEEAYQKYIKDSGIDEFAWIKFSEYVKIDPKTREPLQNQDPSGKAGILITPKNLNVSKLPNISNYYEQLYNMADGEKIVGPIGWMKLFRASLDYGLSQIYPKIDIYSLSPKDYKKLLRDTMKDEKIEQYLLDIVHDDNKHTEKSITYFANFRNKEHDTVPAIYILVSPPNDRSVTVIEGNLQSNIPEHCGVRSARGNFLF